MASGLKKRRSQVSISSQHSRKNSSKRSEIGLRQVWEKLGDISDELCGLMAGHLETQRELEHCVKRHGTSAAKLVGVWERVSALQHQLYSSGSRNVGGVGEKRFASNQGECVLLRGW